jgi:tRNA threonylcarbamoyladenosine dehydratase
LYAGSALGPSRFLVWSAPAAIRIVELMDITEREQDSEAANLERRFGGIRRLYGERALERFRKAHVCVIGIGGVGSWAAEALARSAIGHLTLVDLDHVTESNINRQLHALSGTLGMAKVRVMAERIRQINPACRVTDIEEFLSRENLAPLLSVDYDHVIDCIDGFRIKAALIAHCRRHRIRLVTIGGAGGQTDPTRVQVADLSRTRHDTLFSRTRKLLREDYGFPRNLKRRFDIPCVYSEEQPLFLPGDGGVYHDTPHGADIGRLNCAGGLGSSCAVTATFGLVAAAHTLKKLAAREDG